MVAETDASDSIQMHQSNAHQMQAQPVALFCDGGLLGRNPCPKGGTWAWTAVTRDGEHVREAGGYLLTKNSQCPGWPRVRSETVTNNDCEFYAAMRALESMPDGWTGSLATDSQVTIERLQSCRQGLLPRGFRMDWYSRAHCAFKRLGEVKLIHLAGHPTQQQLLDGQKVKQDGSVARVNRHQVWCDTECNRLRDDFDEHMAGWVQTGLMPASSDNEAA